VTGFRHGIALFLLALLGTGLGGCSLLRRPMHPQHDPGQWYVVDEGETLGDVARRAGVPEEDLLEVNGLRTSAEVHAGSLIYVLDGPGGPVALAKAAPPQVTSAEPARDPGAPPPQIAPASTGPRARFRWPVENPRVTSYFGSRWGRPHEGIDLIAPVGTPVFAADVGDVVYAGNKLRGYGNMVVVRHTGDLMTVYAHNSVLLVKVGDRVLVGQRLALSGQSGHATGPHVHFEVRRGQIPRDPLPFLPNLPGRSPKS